MDKELKEKWKDNGKKFTENNIQEVINNLRDTTLTAFFKLFDNFAKTLTYEF